jgi:phosphoribosyl-ATP pyrophosphohydrolase/phosphoribosyl-AMP cyclohydrolase
MNCATSLGVAELDSLDFAKGGGLLPAVVQHAGSGAVLMLGYMNRAALAATLERRRVVFFSRSRNRLWEKGETSGHGLTLVQVLPDCDRDALLVRAWPQGPVCHTGSVACFGSEHSAPAAEVEFLTQLENVIAQRLAGQSSTSYTAQLAAGGVRRVAQKVGEEGVEVALAAAAGSDCELIAESADLLYHLLVLLKARGLGLQQVLTELAARHARSA